MLSLIESAVRVRLAGDMPNGIGNSVERRNLSRSIFEPVWEDEQQGPRYGLAEDGGQADASKVAAD
jgi:hypothetical protein